MSPTANLFAPIKVGSSLLKNRVVFAPSTRFRVGPGHVVLPHVAEYYTQRASVPGTLLVTEATIIAPRAGGYTHVPGIWSEDQINAWKKVTEGVHSKGSFIYLQLWALGRAASPADLALEDGDLPYVSASDVPLASHGGAKPRPLTIPEIKEYVELFAKGASNAIEAGFDGVEIHSANGYLLDQFLQDVSNKRTDEYGGSPENRTRFALEVVDAIAKAVGAERTAIRVSPWNKFQEMGMENPKPTFTDLITKLVAAHPDLAYFHVVEPRGDPTVPEDTEYPDEISNEFLSKIWGDRPYISAGGHTRQSAIAQAEANPSHLVAFSRAFIATPDLPYRLEHDIPYTHGDRGTYYAYASTDPKGYTDYPFSEQFLEASK